MYVDMFILETVSVQEEEAKILRNKDICLKKCLTDLVLSTASFGSHLKRLKNKVFT